jgi:hypothetical protein
MIPAGVQLPFIPGMMVQKVMRLNQKWASALTIGFVMTSPTIGGHEILIWDYEHIDS